MNDFGFPYEERTLTCEVDIGLVIESLYLGTCPDALVQTARIMHHEYLIPFEI